MRLNLKMQSYKIMASSNNSYCIKVIPVAFKINNDKFSSNNKETLSLLA